MLPWPSEIEPVPDHQAKGQWVRLADVFVIGPMMSYFAVKATSEPMWLRGLMFAFGVGTIVYNGRNYIAVQRYLEAEHKQQAVQGTPWYQEPLVYYPADFAPTDRPSAIIPPPWMFEQLRSSEPVPPTAGRP